MLKSRLGFRPVFSNPLAFLCPTLLLPHDIPVSELSSLVVAYRQSAPNVIQIIAAGSAVPIISHKSRQFELGSK